MRGPRVAVDAAVLAAVVRIDRLRERDVRRVVARDDRARLLDRHRGLQRRQRVVVGGVAERSGAGPRPGFLVRDVFAGRAQREVGWRKGGRAPAVVDPLARLPAEAVLRIERGAAAVDRPRWCRARRFGRGSGIMARGHGGGRRLHGRGAGKPGGQSYAAPLSRGGPALRIAAHRHDRPRRQPAPPRERR